MKKRLKRKKDIELERERLEEKKKLENYYNDNLTTDDGFVVFQDQEEYQEYFIDDEAKDDIEDIDEEEYRAYEEAQEEKERKKKKKKDKTTVTRKEKLIDNILYGKDGIRYLIEEMPKRGKKAKWDKFDPGLTEQEYIKNASKLCESIMWEAEQWYNNVLPGKSLSEAMNFVTALSSTQKLRSVMKIAKNNREDNKWRYGFNPETDLKGVVIPEDDIQFDDDDDDDDGKIVTNFGKDSPKTPVRSNPPSPKQPLFDINDDLDELDDLNDLDGLEFEIEKDGEQAKNETALSFARKVEKTNLNKGTDDIVMNNDITIDDLLEMDNDDVKMED